MPFDYQLVGGGLLLIFAIVGVSNALVEHRSPLAGIVGGLVAVGLLVWAWVLADDGLTFRDVPAAVYRLIAAWR